MLSLRLRVVLVQSAVSRPSLSGLSELLQASSTPDLLVWTVACSFNEQHADLRARSSSVASACRPALQQIHAAHLGSGCGELLLPLIIITSFSSKTSQSASSIPSEAHNFPTRAMKNFAFLAFLALGAICKCQKQLQAVREHAVCCLRGFAADRTACSPSAGTHVSGIHQSCAGLKATSLLC